eukprot:COSAG01_NODE_52933_length_343_cov_0.446721_1_plen_65_part_01
MGARSHLIRVAPALLRPARSHPQEKWLPCHVETGGTQAELVDEEGNKYSCAARECYPMHESSLTA